MSIFLTYWLEVDNVNLRRNSGSCDSNLYSCNLDLGLPHIPTYTWKQSSQFYFSLDTS
jgi:hypothetical protein